MPINVSLNYTHEIQRNLAGCTHLTGIITFVVRHSDKSRRVPNAIQKKKGKTLTNTKYILEQGCQESHQLLHQLGISNPDLKTPNYKETSFRGLIFNETPNRR